MRLVVAAATLLLPSGIAFAQSSGVTLQKVADYPLPGDTSRYDYLSFDPTSHRMYIAHLGQSVVHVFDTQTHTLVGTVEDVPGGHGLLAVPELGVVFEPQLRMVYVAAEDGMVSIFGEDLLNPGNVRLVTNPNAGPNAHSIGLDPETRRVYLPPPTSWARRCCVRCSCRPYRSLTIKSFKFTLEVP